MPELPLTSQLPMTVEYIEHINALSERLKLAYVTATRAQHEGGRVEIHLGSDVVDYLKSFVVAPKPAWIPRETVWGFPIVDSTATPDHISVHVITTIA